MNHGTDYKASQHGLSSTLIEVSFNKGRLDASAQINRHMIEQHEKKSKVHHDTIGL